MDFLDFEAQELYFADSPGEQVNDLINAASDHYGRYQAEKYLKDAFFLAPENLSVHVALYRFFFYQHRLEEALHVARQTLRVSGRTLEMPEDWAKVEKAHLGVGAVKSMGLIRYYFLALKAAGYINIRLGNYEEGVAMLQKVSEMDSVDRLGAKVLLELVKDPYYEKASSDFYSH